MAQTTLEEPFPDGTPARTPKRASLDKTRYTSETFMAPEWDGVWTRCWLFAGLASDIPEAGDYFVFNIGRESVLVLRDEDATVRAFYNVCQHRGNRLFTSESGCVAQIACPYHGWTYALDGVLTTIPDEAQFRPPVDRSTRSLKPVRVELWAGMVWINMDSAAVSLADYLGPIVENLAAFRFEDMVLAQHQTVLLHANSKLSLIHN